jgi:hypothetical protein
MKIEIPEGLERRIEAFCEKNKLDINEFVVDAIIEKIDRSYKEKRRKPRI